jgi:hypothetical protein
MPTNPFLHNYLGEFIKGDGLTSLAAEVEAPDKDQARTQMLNELERRGMITHKQRGKVRKAKSLGEPRLSVRMVDEGTSGAKLRIPWIQKGEVETTMIIPRLAIPQPKIQPQQFPVYGEEEVDASEEIPAARRQFAEARVSAQEEIFPPEELGNVEAENVVPVGEPLMERVFGKSPVMNISRRSGGK